MVEAQEPTGRSPVAGHQGNLSDVDRDLRSIILNAKRFALLVVYPAANF